MRKDTNIKGNVQEVEVGEKERQTERRRRDSKYLLLEESR
jgi:hypothetical protein